MQKALTKFMNDLSNLRELPAANDAQRREDALLTECKMHEATRKQEQRFRALAQAIPQIVWSIDKAGYLDYCNDRWVEYTGALPSKKSRFSWLKAIHRDDRLAAIRAWRRSLNSGRFTFELRMRSKDGQYTWFLCLGIAEKDCDGMFTRWVGTCTDINDRKQWETHLAEAKQYAEEASRAKSAFLANMSHEIRTPLGAMIGFADLLREKDVSSDEKKLYLDVILRNGRDLSQLINDILDLSKIEADRVAVESTKVSLPDLMNSVLSSLMLHAKKKGLTLSAQSDGVVPEVINSDPLRLKQILINIIGNAIKFTHRGGVCVKLRYLSAPANKLEVSVSDTGIGIPKDSQLNLFQRFVQADNSTTRNFGGTGLGLILSRKLAIALGGNVRLQNSQTDVGSTFVITVGVGNIDSNHKALSFPLCPQSSKQAVHTEDLHGMHILVADDAPDNRMLIERMLSSQGAHVELVENGQQAVDKALSQDYDAVLMDIQMPVLDGYSATRELRRRGYERPIIALTAHALADDRERCFRSGCTDHLSKPIARDSLLKTLMRLVTLH